MPEDRVALVVQAVRSGQLAYCKFLSANDSGAAESHQAGILISVSARSILFTQELPSTGILKRTVEIQWPYGMRLHNVFTYYSSKNEFRITSFGRGFPWLKPEHTGDLFIIVKHDEEEYSAFVLNTEEDIEQFLAACGISATETNKLITVQGQPLDEVERVAIFQYISEVRESFPDSNTMACVARDIQNRVYGNVNYVTSNPDQKLISWVDLEYRLFRILENARHGAQVRQGFQSIDDFVSLASTVLNRRKSRAGKSFEHHLAAVFSGNHLSFTAQAVTEGRKTLDFLFPSQAAYRDAAFPVEHLLSLAAKTTCKDRWRQVLNEAARLRGRPKYLCTLQQGISPAQMDEMQEENVILVVPRPYISTYPRDRQNRILTLLDFIRLAQGLVGQ